MSMRYINTRDRFLEIRKINEDRGPLGNDIKWGDSIVGRMFNSLLRKARVGVKLSKIDDVSNRIRGIFDEMLGTALVDELPDADKKELTRLKMYYFIDELREAVEKGDSIDTLKNITKFTISNIKSAEDFDTKDDLLEQLNKFLDYLNSLDVNSDDGSDSDSDLNEGVYKYMVKNLKSLSTVVKNYNKVSIGGNNVGVDNVSTNVGSNRSVNVNINTPELLTSESFGREKGKDFNNIKPEEKHATESFNKLVADIKQLISPKYKGISIDGAFIDSITSVSVDSGNKEHIKSLYYEVYRYIYGDKKATLQDKDVLYESIDILSNKNKMVIVAEKIARFSKRAILFDKEGLYGQIGEIGQPLKDFVDSINKICEFYSKNKPKSNVTQNENHTFINESSNVIDKVRLYWEKNIDVDSFTIKKEEAIKLRNKFNDMESSRSEYIVIDGIDPVIEIIKCFNRAYKLHTTQVIPTGRTGGAVSNSVFREYTSYGGGNKDSAGRDGGPYRNNAIFDKWEDSIMDILKERKYQPIFNDKTKLLNGGKYIDKAGASLRKFMTDMLDGEDLYRTKGGQGSQSKFLDKYFGYSIGNDTSKLAFDGDKEYNEVTEVANKMPNKVELKFIKESVSFNNISDLAGTFFAMNTDDGVYYLFIQEVGTEMLYIVYSKTFYFFEKYISESGVVNKLNSGDIKLINLNKLVKSGDSEFRLKVVRKKLDNILNNKGEYRLRGKYEFIYLYSHDGKKNVHNNIKKSNKPDILTIDSFYTLIDTKTNKRFKLTSNITQLVDKVGGFKNIRSIGEIDKTKIVK